MIHKLFPKHYHEQTNGLNKNMKHTLSDVYIDSDSGDEQYSNNLKETSFNNIIKENNSKTNSPS